MKAVCVALAALLVGEIAVFAQIGSPYPPNRYPGAGVPMPSRGKKKSTTTNLPDDEQFSYVTGKLRLLDENQVVVEARDTRIINLKRTPKTKFTKDALAMDPSELKPGDTLLIEANQDTEGFYTAVNVIFQKQGTAAERADAARAVVVSTQASDGKNSDDERPRLRRADSPPKPDTEEPEETAPTVATATSPVPKQEASLSAAPDPDDPGPPKLRRGVPTRRAQSTQRETQEIAVATPPPALPSPTPAREQEPPAPEDPVIEKAREAAEGFTESLPNYICQQFTARFVNTSHVTNWQAQDVISAEVVYENGHESYRNLAINGKAVKKKMEELSGAWSTGEFGTLLRDLFSPSTAAAFVPRRDATIAGKTAAVYSFQVQRENSHWRVQVPSQSVYPAYKGSVWIDKTNGRVLRIEMQARNVPSEFPLDAVEVATDYEYVRIGGTQQFLLPVHSETLSCQRGTNTCSRNTIDFRNYKKYSGEASIIFEKN
jgi:hypothetical protein